MKIRSVTHNNRKKVFEVRASTMKLVFPFSKADPPPTIEDPIAELSVDAEAGREAFTYVLHSGRTGTVHVEQVLEYNQDPSYLRDLLLYRLTLEAQGRIAESSLSKREIMRRLGTSAAQLYRLLDQTNYRKSLDQVLALLQVLGCEVDLVARSKPTATSSEGTVRTVQANHFSVLQRITHDLTPNPEGPLHAHWLKLPEERPLPWMVFLAFAEILKFPCAWKPMEKTLWAMPVKYRGVPFTVEHAKFGLGVMSDASEAATLLPDLLRTLDRASRVADKIMRPVLEEQISKRHVTIRNLYSTLHSRYLFFREHALASFRTPPPDRELTSRSADGRITGWSQDIFKPKREGFFYSTAAVEAFFSRLEHLLVLCVPFGPHAHSIDLSKHLAAGWAVKYRSLVDFSSDRRGKRVYDALRAIKEQYRNPLAHGGFEKGSGSLLVHVPSCGAIPASLSEFRDGLHYTLYPLSERSFQECCAVFDECDSYFETGPLRRGYRYASTSLNVAFDEESIREYQAASASDEAFEELIDRTCHLMDMDANMDW